MKILMIHVGNPVQRDPALPAEHYYERYSFETGDIKLYLKKDIVNADSQMQSLMDLGLDISYGYFGARRSLLDLWTAGRKLSARVKNENIDLVHVLWGTTSSLVTVLFSPAPVVISFCGSDVMGNYNAAGKKTMGGRITRLLSVISSLFARQIIVKSSLLRDNLPKMVHHKCTVIPNGVDTSIFYPVEKTEARQKLGWDQKEKIILFFTGSGAHVKNRPLAEQVFELLKQRIPEARFLAVEGVLFEDLLWYYNAADMLLMTSFHEGSNNSIKESMACNLPVVSVNCGDAKERLAEVRNSFVSDSYDAETLADAAVSILKTGGRSNGRDHILPYSTENVALKVLDVYKKALR